MDIILFYNFNSLIWLTGIVEVVSTCSHQPKLITCSKNDNDNYNVPFLHVFNWKSNKHEQQTVECGANVCLMSGQRRRRWTSSKLAYWLNVSCLLYMLSIIFCWLWVHNFEVQTTIYRSANIHRHSYFLTYISNSKVSCATSCWSAIMTWGLYYPLCC